MLRQPRSTRNRLILIVTAVLVVGFLGTTLLSHQIIRETMREAVLETELPLTGDNIYSEIQADLVRPIFVASLMANDTFVHDWVKAGEPDPMQMRRYLTTIRARYGVFTAFFISDATRNYYHFTGIDQVVSEEDPLDVWYFRARAMDTSYEINVDPNQAQDNAVTIFINHRVVDVDDTFLGVTGVGLELAAVADIVKRYQADFGRSVYFVDSMGRMTVHPDPEAAYSLRLEDVEGLAPYVNAILSQERGSFRIERASGDVLMTTRYIPELDWTLVVEAAEENALPGYGTGFASSLAIGLVAITLTLGAIILAVGRYQRRLEALATTDPLTGLANRQKFDSALTEALNRARRSGQPLSLVLFDIDRFKTVNDRLGHQAGDAALCAVAGLAAASVRATDTLARWGGEEFMLLMENCDNAKAREIADQLRIRIAEADVLATLADAPQDAPLTASFGIATVTPVPGPAPEMPVADMADRLISDADRALYDAKAAGRNRVAAAA